VWGGAPKTSLLPLLRKQKKIIRTMLFEPNTSPSSPLFFKLKLLKLDEIYSFKLGILMHNQSQNINNITPKLPLISSIHNHNTRSNNGTNIYISTVNSNLAKTAYSYSGPSVWNAIPMSVRASPILKFKSLYKDLLLSNYLPIP
jgi:hypothetical protein